MDYLVKIMYEEPKIVPGFMEPFYEDYVKFDSLDESRKYVACETAYDYLDECVKLKVGEKALYLVDMQGTIIWENEMFKKDDFKISIRALSIDDAEQVKVLDDASGNWVGQWLEDNEDYAWGLFKEEVLIGYCTIGYADDCGREIENYPGWNHDSLLLSDVYIKPEHRHKGYASKLVDDVIKNRTETEKELVFLTVLYDNLYDLYEKVGFKRIGNGVMVRDEREKFLSLDEKIKKGKDELAAGKEDGTKKQGLCLGVNREM